VQRHIQGVIVPRKFQRRLRERQGGAKQRALGLRKNIYEEAQILLGSLSDRDRLMLLVGMYWGEGTKKDFAIINSDPLLLQTFVKCLRTIFKIPNNRISGGLRVHRDISIEKCRKFWSQSLAISPEAFHRSEIIEGKKKGKLPYGMCRIRVRSGIKERVLVQTLISLIGKESKSKVLSR